MDALNNNTIASVSDVAMTEPALPQEQVMESEQPQEEDVSSRASSGSDLSFDNRAELDNKENSKSSSLPLPAPAAAPVRPPNLSKKALKFLGADPEQVARTKALKQLGLTEQDLYMAGPLFESPEQRERAQMAFEKRGYSPKLLALTGMTEAQIMRRKALKCLGVTEQMLDREREERLASMGCNVVSSKNTKIINSPIENSSTCLPDVKPQMMTRVAFSALPFVPHRAHTATTV